MPPVRSQGVRARSSTVTATSAAVQRVQSRSFLRGSGFGGVTRSCRRAWPNGSPGADTAPAPVDEEIPTQPIPRVKMPRQQLSTQEMADPGAADRGAVDAQKVDREKVDPAADDGTGRSSPRTSPTAPRTIERESRRPSCPTTYVRRRCAKSASLNEPVTRAPSPATSGPGSTRFSTCRGAPRPRTR